jgi:hypothetical protein
MSIRLIVNADDYGYFPCISQGILQAAHSGAVTATGILANGPNLEAQLRWLRECENLDLGLHLNLTSRQPLTRAMASQLAGSGFPSAYAIAGKILAGRINLAIVRTEWRAQIEAVLNHGATTLRFLNSHEHVHMLPSLFGLALELAREYQIPHVRLTRAEWLPPFGFSAVLRNTLMQAMEWANRPHALAHTPAQIGLGRSGKLDMAYLKSLFATLKPGITYELMCHPGLFDATEITDPQLLSYHAWQDELALLTSPQLRELYDEYGIRLVNYRT